MYSGIQSTILIDESIYDVEKIDYNKDHTDQFILFDFAQKEVAVAMSNGGFTCSDGSNIIQWGLISRT